jgi:hypothetical protein
MKTTSKYFDKIRVSTARETAAAEKAARERQPPCQWKGCEKPGPHRAPMGRGRDGQFFQFCVDHVRQYNQSYNYFDGMNDSEVADFQKDAMTGHRPTWKMGAGVKGGATREGVGGDPTRSSSRRGKGPQDPHEFFAWREEKARAQAANGRRVVRPLEKKSLETMGLPESASKIEVKARFKELVKMHHPDANGGDTRSEEKLREIIQAYNYLKTAGLV